MALILVTGASAGLGLATVSALVEAGHDVVLHARNADRVAGKGVRERVHRVVYGDLAHLDETVRLAQQANAIGRFDAVIHNAGVLRGSDVYAVNVVAPYVLTASMTPPERTIFLSSSMHLSGSADVDTIDFDRSPIRGRAYENSKLYVTALAMACATQRPHSMSHAVDPGWVPTRMGGPAAPDSLEEGHRTQEWLATAEASLIRPRSGAYWHHRKTRRPHPAVNDKTFQDELLRKLEMYTGVTFS
jgi:NAD(P)-dependent dehydrogenase (short-subunit alcohol dehydrogenase family)